MAKLNNICLPSFYQGKIETDDIRPKRNYLVIIFYPYDFTTVCPTEIIAASELKEKFQSLDADVVFVSTDSVYSHKEWAEGNLKNKVAWPMLSDFMKELSISLNMLSDDGASRRGTVIIDKDMKIRHYSYNENRVGRSVKEMIRLVKAIRHVDTKGEMCLVDWDE